MKNSQVKDLPYINSTDLTKKTFNFLFKKNILYKCVLQTYRIGIE